MSLVICWSLGHRFLLGTAPCAATATTLIPRFARRAPPTLITKPLKFYPAGARNMSSSAPPQTEFIVHIPDFPGALEKRLAARPNHLSRIQPLVESGHVLFGGATLSKQPAEGEVPDMTGSMLLVKANSEEEVRRLLETDAYTKGGVWDVEKATIWPFKSAIRTAL